jgi:hypothetical protein
VAIDAQLDPEASPEVQKRRLEHAARKIAYWQRRAAHAATCHRKRRARELAALGIDFDRVVRCPTWPTLSTLDLTEPLDPARWAPR